MRLKVGLERREARKSPGERKAYQNSHLSWVMEAVESVSKNQNSLTSKVVAVSIAILIFLMKILCIFLSQLEMVTWLALPVCVMPSQIFSLFGRAGRRIIHHCPAGIDALLTMMLPNGVRRIKWSVEVATYRSC